MPEPTSDVLDDLRAGALAGTQVHVDLVHVHALGVLVELRAAGAAAHRHHFRYALEQPLGETGAR